MIIARWYESCLVLVSIESWEELLKRLSGISGPITSPIRDIDRFIHGMAFKVVIDKQGRFILPELLIDYSNIKNEVVFVGLGDRVELWAAEKWKNIEEVVQEKAEKAIETVAQQKK